MENQEHARPLLTDLFATQHQAVLATQQGEQPYTSLMAFVATPDLSRLLFATYRGTHKYTNLSANPRAAMLIDNRTAHLADHYQGIAVTATGRTGEIAAEDREPFLRLYLARHPNLTEFIHSPGCALMELRVEHYYIVSQLHNVLDLAISP
jgi:nitroimidazol reductase NimA-like FMN-containing flavoprotein (pyridoxamine 5'-phosphate oxidase superfamily)